MTTFNLAGQSKTPPPPAKPPSFPPKTPPPPSKPPKQDADDAIFLAVALLRVDLARPHKPAPPSKPPRKPINTKPIRSASQSPARRDPMGARSLPSVAVTGTGGPVSSRHGGREESPTSAGVAADSEGRVGSTPPGAVPSMPKPLGPPRFTNPPPPPPPPFPPPHPAPPPVLPRPGEPEFGRRRPGDTAKFLGSLPNP